jgi:hypothetical protein
MKIEYDWQEVRKHVEECAVARKKNGVLKSEGDFFSGAMVMLEALTGEAPNTYWTMSILCGRSIIKEHIKEMQNAGRIP